MSLVDVAYPVTFRNRFVRHGFEISSPVHIPQINVLSDSSDGVGEPLDYFLSETDSFVEESTDVFDSESDCCDDSRWYPVRESHEPQSLSGLSEYLNSQITRSSQCHIDGEYSSSCDESMDGLDTDIPVQHEADAIESMALSDTDISQQYLC